MKKTYFCEECIQPSDSTYGHWDASHTTYGTANDVEAGELFETAECLLDAVRAAGIWEFYEIGVDDLPDGLDDITGSIYNEPDRVFGYISDEDEAVYFGISSVDVEIEN